MMQTNAFMEALLFEDVFDRVIYSKVGTPSREAIKEILLRSEVQTSPRPLGSGAYGVVYGNAKDDSTVFKVGDANYNSGYMTYLRLIKDKVHPYFPKIVQADLFVNKATGRAQFLIEMERLVDYEEITDGRGRMGEKYGGISYTQFADNIRWHLTARPESVEAKRPNLPFDMPKEYYDAVDMIRDAQASRESETYWDLNLSNIMFRERDQQMVITDPMV